jgi:hypothetical protein
MKKEMKRSLVWPWSPSAHVVDHGGRVLKKIDVTPVYLGAYWQSARGLDDRKYFDGATADLVKNKGLTGVWKQYGAGKGTVSRSLGIPVNDPRRVSRAQLEALVKKAVARGSFDASNPQRVFMLMLPPQCVLTAGRESSSRGLGGFHSSVSVNGREVYYSAIVYSQRGNGLDFAGEPRKNVTIAASHEVSEAVTDPDVEVANRTGDRRKLGWYDDVTGKGEIADVPVDDEGLRAWGYSDGFAFQKLWSEKDQRNELAPR